MTTGKAKERILERVLNSDNEVFLRSDFSDIANYQQAGRALNSLISEGRLIRISKGVYAKARKNRITGKPMLSAAGGFIAVAEEALDRLGIKWSHSKAMATYKDGSSQVPVNCEVVIEGKFQRIISAGNCRLRVFSNKNSNVR